MLSIKDEVKFLNKLFEKAAASGATFRAAGCTVIYGARALFIFPSPLDEGRVLLRPPKPQRQLGGGQPDHDRFWVWIWGWVFSRPLPLAQFFY